MNMNDYTIVSIYGAEYRGVVQYYLMASDVYQSRNTVRIAYMLPGDR